MRSIGEKIIYQFSLNCEENDVLVNNEFGLCDEENKVKFPVSNELRIWKNLQHHLCLNN